MRTRAEVIAHRFPFLGCSRAEFITWIESLWANGMNWSNYGRGVGRWCIDHVKPKCDTDWLDPGAWERASHFTNLRPLWFTVNSRDKSRAVAA